MSHRSIEVRITDPRIHSWGLPKYMTSGSAGIDLYACTDQTLILAPQAPALLIPSGIAVLIADPFIAGLILPRSGLGHKKGLVLGNGVGLLDADFSATIMISAWNRNPAGDPITIAPGDRIAQLVFVPVVRPRLDVVETFSVSTERGESGFGSTGT
ncbi:MAG: dUTP diphosphatase [Acidiferrobacteraceae bacterium]